MTRDQIIAKWNTLSSRERDAWVAEVVFGDTSVFNVGEYWFCGDGMLTLPFYTEDITAAWKVLTHNGIYGDISYMGDQCRAEVWARWNPETGVGENEYAVSNSETEAICLAAIFAKLIAPTV
jgi:hypothetical protein